MNAFDMMSRSHFRKSGMLFGNVLGLFSLLISNLAFAQSAADIGTQPSTQARAAAGPGQLLEEDDRQKLVATPAAQRVESRIGPDDLLDIAIFEAPEMNRTVRVSANGEISLQLLGGVRAAGMTPRELESALGELLRQTYMKDPHVGVFVQELQSHAVSVVGAVKKPGVFQIRGTKTVIEVLSMAEGLADDAGDTVLIMHNVGYAEQASSDENLPAETAAVLFTHEVSLKTANHNSSVQREKRQVEEIKLKTLLDSADPSVNVAVRPGDIVKVPRAGIVYVVGEVKKPGGFVLQGNEKITVLQALALAEGPTHTSATSQSKIIHTDSATGSRTEIPMNLGKILSGKSPDRLLQPEDIVFIPNSVAKSVFYRSSEAALQTATGVAIYRW